MSARQQDGELKLTNFVREELGQRRDPSSLPAQHGQLLKSLTINLVDTYSNCCGDFSFTQEHVPRRVLTKPAEAAHNNGYDNIEFDYICRVRDTIESESRRQFEIQDWLGRGTFGQVLKCQVVDNAQKAPTCVALKVIRSKTAYTQQAKVEVDILQKLNKLEPHMVGQEEDRIVRMLEHFTFRKHLCIAFELLSENLYQVLQRGSHRGLSLANTKLVTAQLLEALMRLRHACIIHCDLKPENVMMASLNPIRIKLIDFGSACREDQPLHSYIQSRFYRAPEVLLGLRYTSAIDMWSLGCICAEVFRGVPLFPGITGYDQVRRVVKLLGPFPEFMITSSRHGKRYFSRNDPDLDCMPELQCKIPGHTEKSLSHECQDCVRYYAEWQAWDLRRQARQASAATRSPTESGNAEATTTASTEPAADAAAATATTTAGSAATVSTSGSAGGQPDGPASSCGSSTPALGPTSHDPPAADQAQRGWRLKSVDEFRRELNHKDDRRRAQLEEKGLVPPEHKQEQEVRSLDHLMQVVHSKAPRETDAWVEEQERRLAFRQMLGGMLALSPSERWTASQAQHHPFVTGAPHVPEFRPVPDDAGSSRRMMTVADSGAAFPFEPHHRRHFLSSTTVTPASSPHGSVTSTHRSEKNSVHGHYSRNQPHSPWHLASDVSRSSHMSGSESSCTEEGDANLHGPYACGQRSGSGHLSSGGQTGTDSEANPGEADRNAQDQRWRNLDALSKTELLPKRMSPGGTSGENDFRNKVGMPSVGPVVPPRQSACSGGSGRGAVPNPGGFLSPPGEDSAGSTRSLPGSARSAGSWNSAGSDRPHGGPVHSQPNHRRRRYGHRLGGSSR